LRLRLPRAGFGRERLTAWKALHAATRGARSCARTRGEIGSFDPGCAADLTIWDWSTGALDSRRQAQARSLHEKVFAWMVLGDERHLVETRVAESSGIAGASSRRPLISRPPP
jgi:guanine deaminase